MKIIWLEIGSRADRKKALHWINATVNYASLRATIKGAVEIFFVRWQRNANQLDLLKP